MQSAANHPPRNLSGGAWLMADMALNIWALTIVKLLGLGYPAAQVVFLRAAVGLVIMVPWAIAARASFAKVDNLKLHALRVVFSTLALSASFFALPRLPFALVTAISFTRPAVTMIMAVIFLNEVVSGRRWLAAALAFLGVIIAVQPGEIAWTWGLPAMGVSVLCGTSAIILTRRLSQTPTVVMMAFYTAGLTLLSAPIAAFTWVEISTAHLAPLLAIGVFSQSAQFCFLQAHRNAEAGFLAILGYSSLLVTTAIGYLLFDEIPTIAFGIGASLIIAAAIWTTIPPRDRT